MQNQEVKIGLTDFAVGPFPDRSKMGLVVKQWRLLSQAKMLGFDEEEITTYAEEFVSLCSSTSLENLAESIRASLLYFRDNALTVAKSLSETIGKTKNNDITTDSEGWIYGKAAKIIALFCALCAYLSRVEREGCDKANALSFNIYSDFCEHAFDLLFHLPTILDEIQREKPSEFVKRLWHYPENDYGDISLIRYALLELREHKCLRWTDIVERFKNDPMFKSQSRRLIPLNASVKARENSKPDLSDPSHYLEALMVALLLGRDDFVTKGINLNIAQAEGLATMDGNYAALGGEQWVAESLAQDYLDKRSQAIREASVLDGEAFRRSEKALDTLETVMSRFKKESTNELKEVEKLDKLTRPMSVDTKVEDEEGETTSLSECLPAEQDMLEAEDRYYEAVSHLPEGMQPIFRRVWEEGETPKQAAINLGHEWTSALERKIERMKNKIYEEILN